MGSWKERKIQEAREQGGLSWKESRIQQAQERQREEEQARRDALARLTVPERIEREKGTMREGAYESFLRENAPDIAETVRSTRLSPAASFAEAAAKYKASRQEKYAPAVDFESEEVQAILGADRDALQRELEAIENDPRSYSQKENEIEEYDRLNYLQGTEMLRGREDFAQLSRPKEIEKTGGYSIFPSADTDTLYQFINDTGDYDRETVRAMSVGTGQAQEYGGYEEYLNLRQDEIQMYNYLYNTRGKEQAEKYLDMLKPALEERRYTEYQDYLRDLAEQYPVLTSVASVPANLLGGVVSGADMALSYLNGDTINPYSYAQQAGAAAETIRGKVGEDMSGFGKFLYDTGMSGADSLAASLLPGGALVLGAGAGASNARDILQRGGTTEQAILGGVAAGAFETIFERWSIGNLKAFKEMPSGTLKQSLKNAAKSVLVNASEEAATEAANIAFDALTMGDMSNWQASIDYYISQGKSEEDAIKWTVMDSVAQVGLAAASGGLMGGMFSVPGAISSNIESGRIGKQINAQEGARDALMDLALRTVDESDSQRIAQKMQDKGKTGNVAVGNLYKTTAQDVATAYKEFYPELSEDKRSQLARKELDDVVFRAAEQTTQEQAEQPQQVEKTPAATVAKNATPTQPSENIVQQAAPQTEEQAAPMQQATYKAQDVTVKGISSVENSTVYVNLSDGGVVKADEVEFADPNVQDLYETAKTLDTNSAKAFVSHYDGSVDVNSYAQGFLGIYGAARTGESFDGAVAKAGLMAQRMSPTMQQAAYYAGQNAGKMTDAAVPASAAMATENSAEQAAKPAADVAQNDAATEEQVVEYKPAQGKKGGVKRIGSKKLTASQQNQINALDVVFKAFGRTVEVVDSIDVKIGNEVRKSAANALFDPSTNTYKIALDGVGEAYTHFAVHESVHDIKVNNPEGYNVLEAITLQYLQETGEDVDALVEYQMQLNDSLSEEAAREEVIANSVPAILTDPETGKAFAERFLLADEDTRNVFQKLLDSILNFLQKAHDALVGSERSWQQMEALEADIEAVTSIREAYFDALEGLKNNATENTVVKFSRADGDELSIKAQIAKYQEQLNKMEPVGTVESGKRPLKNGKPDREQMRKELLRIFGSKTFSIDRIGFGGISFDEKAMHQAVNYIKTDAEYAAVKLAPAVVKRGIQVDYHTEHKGRNELESYTFAAPVMMNEKRANVGAVVQITNRAKIHAVRVLSPDGTVFELDINKKRARTDSAATNGGRQQRNSSAFNEKVSEKRDSVKWKHSLKDSNGNTLTEQQAEHFKDSKVRDEQGRLKVMYRGDNAEFTVFDRKKSRYSNLYGRGFYFTDSEAHARQYGGAREFYLNIKNPLPTDETTITRSQMRKFLKAVAKNEDDFSFENYGYGATVDSVLKSVYGKSDFAMLYDVNQTAVGDMVAAVELFNDVNGTNFDGLILDTETVAFYSNQAKNIDNLNPTEDPDIRFSLKDVTPVDVKTLEKQNEKLQAVNKTLREQFELTRGRRVSEADTRKIAKKVLADYSSKYSADELTENLGEIFKYLETNPNASIEDIMDMGVGLARKVLEQSSELNTEMQEYYKDAKDYLRNTGITLTEVQKAEAAAQYDSYNNYRRKLFGSVKLVNNGLSLDEAWQELSAQYPGLFDADVAEGDMVALLDAAVQTMKPGYDNPYGYNMDEAAFDLFLGIVDSYYEAPKMKTFADKKAEQIAQLRQRLRDEKAALRKESKEKYDAKVLELKALQALKRQELSQEYNRLLAEGKEKNKERIAELRKQYRESSNAKVLKERARYQKMIKESAAKRKETEARQKHRKSIEATAKTLAEWLARPTDKKHVPEVLRNTVNDFLQTIDFGSAAKPNTQKAVLWREKLKALNDQMAKIDAGQDAYTNYFADIDPDLMPRLDAFIGGATNVKTIGDMTAEQLKELDFLIGMIKRTVTTANALHANARYASVANLGDATLQDMANKKTKKARGRTAAAVDNLLNVHQLDSFAYFDRLGSAAKTVLGGLRTGLDTKTVKVKQAMDYMDGALKDVSKSELAAMTGKNAKLHTFKTEGNQTIQLTTAQIMELYLLNQRPQARGHIYGGGIRPTSIEVKNGRKTVRINNVAPVKVTEADVANITKVLTAKQRRVADQMQSFVGSQVAEWGNEVSMTMYGYKKFNEANYWPIRSDSNYTRTNDSDSMRSGGGGDLYQLKNLGMTKATIAGANNPLTLGDAFDTFTRHVDDMGSYNAFVVPLSDAMKWFNYVDKEGGKGSVKQELERYLGKEGQNYFINLIRDINGANKSGVSVGAIDMLMRNAKTAAVGANMRVVLQQPTAYVRAAAEISPKYLAQAATGFFSKANVEKAKKYSPIAQWKSWGFFDLSVGRSMRELIVGDQTTSQRLKEKSLAAAGWADEHTWGTLWKACELEVRDKNPSLKGEEFNVAVGKRLSEIIDRTQVVDSVLHRSQLMRSKNGLYALYTSFMAEPTKSYNLLRTALADMLTNNNARTRGRFGRVTVSFVAASVATAAAAAIADAFREEDDEKSFLEKWLGSFGANVADNVNVFGMIPVAKELVSLMNGYSVSRIDLQGAERVLDFGGEVIRMLEGKSTWNVQKLLYEGSKALSSVTGIPVSNALRTLTSAYNTAVGGITWQNETATAKATYETMNRALLEGNTDKYGRLYQKMVDKKVANYKEEEAKRKAAGETLKYADEDSMVASAKDAVDSSMADLLMADPAIEKAYEHRAAGRASALSAVYKELQAKGYNFNTITKAINKYENMVTAEPAQDEYEPMKQYDSENLVAATRAAFTSGNTHDAQIIYDSLFEHSDADDPAKSLRSTASENFRLEYIEQVEAGNTGKVERMADVLTEVFGYDQGDLDDWVKEWRGKQMNDAIGTGDASAANGWIRKMQADGRPYSSIRSSITSKYKPLIVEAYNNGDMTTYNMLVDTLLAIDLYTEKGKKAFTADDISGWLEPDEE